MHQINLLPWRQILRRKQKQKLICFVIYTDACFFILYLLAHIVLSILIYSKETKVKYWQQQLTNIDKQVIALKDMREELNKFSHATEFFNHNRVIQITILNLCRKIIAITPLNITLQEMNYRDDKILLIGKAESVQALNQFVNQLSVSQFLKKPKLTEIENQPKNSQIKFKIQAMGTQRLQFIR